MAFDGIITKAVVSELKQVLIGGKINKVYEPNKNEILLGIYSGGKNYALEISINSSFCRMHLTTRAKPNPTNALNFCMLLRKHLIGYRIQKIETSDLDRIVFIELEGRNELNDLNTKKLIIELMGKHSNIILTNEKDVIIDSLRHIDSENSTRQLLPAHFYELPENTKSSFLSLQNFNDFLSVLQENTESLSLDKWIASHFIGFSLPFVQNLSSTLNLSSNDTSTEALKKMYDSIGFIVSHLNTSQVSCKMITTSKGKRDYILDTLEKKSPLEINFFLDDFYHDKEENENFILYRNTLLKIILEILEKYKARLNNINQKIKEAEQRDKYQLYGELITCNLYRISNQNCSEITVENYYDNNNLITIPLDHTISPASNAKKYFKKYNKLKNASEIAVVQKKDTLVELNYIESIIYELDSCHSIEDINTIYEELMESKIFEEKMMKKKKESPKKNKTESSFTPTSTLIDGHTVFIGKNNKENDYLTTKLAHSNDLWFHTKDIHGSHVILKTDGNEIEESTLIRCAQIAAFHSKAKLSSNVPVDYCFIRYVKKPNKSKPGMVIYTNNKTLYVNPQSE